MISMKKAVLILMASLGATSMVALAADEPVVNKTPPSKKASAKKPAVPSDSVMARLPAGAKAVGPNEWSYTDPQGKKWIYRRTPFSLAKLDAAQDAAVSAESASDRSMLESTKAEDAGANVRFSRPGPFGPLRWTAAKTELDEFERKVWERDQQKAAPHAPAATPATSASQE